MKAVHFGAGNIGRGFVGQLQHADSYVVHEIGGTDHVVTDFRAINSRTHEAELVEEIATADVVTTAVGPRILPFVAPVIARGIQRRLETLDDVVAGDAKLVVLACENAINATDG